MLQIITKLFFYIIFLKFHYTNDDDNSNIIAILQLNINIAATFHL